MTDEKRQNHLDDDILQGKQDVLRILRSKAAPEQPQEPDIIMPHSEESPSSSVQSLQGDEPDIVDTEFLSEDDSVVDFDILDFVDEENQDIQVPDIIKPTLSVDFAHSAPIQTANSAPDGIVSQALEAVQDLREQLASKNAQRQSLQERLASFEQEKNDLLVRHQALLTELDTQKKQIKAFSNNQQQIVTKYSHLKSRLSELQEHNQQLQSEISAGHIAQDEFQRTASALSEAEFALSREQGHSRQLENRVHELEGQLDTAVQERDHFKQRFESADEKREKFSDEIERLRTQHAEEHDQFGRQIETLKKQLEQAEQERLETHQLHETARKESESQLAQAWEAADLLVREKEQLARQKNELGALVDHHEKELQSAHARLSGSDRAMAEYRDALQQIEALQAQDNSHQQEIQQLQQALFALEQQKESTAREFEEKLQSLRQENVQLAGSIEALKEQNERDCLLWAERNQYITDENLKLQDSLHDLLSQSDQSRADKEKLAVELSALNQRHGDESRRLSERLAGLERENGDLKTTLQQLQLEQQTQTQAAQKQTESLQLRIDELLEDNHKQTLRCEALRQTVGDKDALLEAIQELRAAHERLELEKAEMQSRFDSMHSLRQTEFEDLRAVNTRLTDTNRELKNTVSRQETMVASLKTDIEQLQIRAERLQEIQTFLTLAQEANERLKQENASLREHLHDVQIHTEPLEPAIADDAENLDSAPYAVSASVPEETPQAAGEIPTFNLAEQILAEHRKAVAGRRRRIIAAGPEKKRDAVEQVVRQYIKPQLSPPAALVPPQPPKTHVHYLWYEDTLTPFQQDILQEIIEKDILYHLEKKAV